MALRLRPIKDQVIVISGGATGIGIGAGRAAARKRARIMLIGGEDAGVGEVARAINNAGGRADFAIAATDDRAALSAAAASAVERFGRIDSWINDADPKSVTAGCAVALPLLERGGGALITIVDSRKSSRAIVTHVGSVRAKLRSRGQVAVCLVALPEGEVAQLEAAVDVVLDCATRPRDSITVGEDKRTSLVARVVDHPRTAAAVGLGGLVLAIGALVARRRTNRNA